MLRLGKRNRLAGGGAGDGRMRPTILDNDSVFSQLLMQAGAVLNTPVELCENEPR